MLTTYRADGSAVSTPVGYGIAGDRLYFMTQPGTHKVRRLASDPRCTIAASTLRGTVTGPPLPGTAVLVHGSEADEAVHLITAHNRVAWWFLLRRRRNRPWAVYEVNRNEIGSDDA